MIQEGGRGSMGQPSPCVKGEGLTLVWAGRLLWWGGGVRFFVGIHLSSSLMIRSFFRQIGQWRGGGGLPLPLHEAEARCGHYRNCAKARRFRRGSREGTAGALISMFIHIYKYYILYKKRPRLQSCEDTQARMRRQRGCSRCSYIYVYTHI